MSDEIIATIQAASNPFKKSNVKSAWEEDIFDVESINSNCFNEILNEINDISRGNIGSYIHLMLGEVGLGKTHLLARLRKKAIEKDFYFVEIEPVPNLDKLFVHILRELSGNLRKKIPNSDFTFLEQLVANLLFQQMEKVLKEKRKFINLLNELKKSPTKIFKLKLSQDDLNDIKEIMIPRINKDYPGIEIQLVQVLFESIYPRKFLYAIKWLQCESLSEDEMELINATVSIDEETLAFNILKSLLILTDKTVVFAFDQIESIERSFGIIGLKKFFQLIVNIYNTCKNHLSLIMVQTGVWNTYVRDNLDQSVIDRIETVSSLEKLTVEQSSQIIAKRMEIIWKRSNLTPPDNCFPFTAEEIKIIAQDSAWNPRKLIKNAATHFKKVQSSFRKEHFEKAEPIEPMDEEIDKDEMEYILKTIHKNEEKYHVEYFNSSSDKRGDIIISILHLLLRRMKENNISKKSIYVNEIELNKVFERGKTGINLFLHLECKNNKKKVGIECNNASNMNVVFHSLNRLKNYQESGYLDNCIFIREKDLIIRRTAKRTVELINWIQSNGKFIEVNPKTNIKLYAIKRLLDSAGAEELSFNNQLLDYNKTLDILVESIVFSLQIIIELFSYFLLLFKMDIDSDITEKTELNTTEDLTKTEDDVWNFIKESRIVGLDTIKKQFPDVNEKYLLSCIKNIEATKQISVAKGPNNKKMIYLKSTYNYP